MKHSKLTLAQYVGIRKGSSQRATSALTKLHRNSASEAAYSGFHKGYQPLAEDGETYPPEGKKVALTAHDVFGTLRGVVADYWDINATCDRGNMVASADVVVDGAVLVANAPVPLLLFLDKRVDDLIKLVDSMPTLAPDETWTQDPNTGQYRSDVVVSHRSVRIEKPVVLYPATTEHPAQTKMVPESVVTGHWHAIKYSGALAEPVKRAILGRLRKLSDALSFAVSKANEQPVAKASVAGPLLSFIFPE